MSGNKLSSDKKGTKRKRSQEDVCLKRVKMKDSSGETAETIPYKLSAKSMASPLCNEVQSFKQSMSMKGSSDQFHKKLSSKTSRKEKSASPSKKCLPSAPKSLPKNATDSSSSSARQSSTGRSSSSSTVTSALSSKKSPSNKLSKCTSSKPITMSSPKKLQSPTKIPSTLVVPSVRLSSQISSTSTPKRISRSRLSAEASSNQPSSTSSTSTAKLPKTASPKTATLKTATPKTATPKTAMPKTATSKTATLKTATPKTATPKTATLKTATPKTATSKTATSKTATPKTAMPKTATSKTATPKTTTPNIVRKKHSLKPSSHRRVSNEKKIRTPNESPEDMTFSHLSEEERKVVIGCSSSTRKKLTAKPSDHQIHSSPLTVLPPSLSQLPDIHPSPHPPHPSFDTNIRPSLYSPSPWKDTNNSHNSSLIEEEDMEVDDEVIVTTLNDARESVMYMEAETVGPLTEMIAQSATQSSVHKSSDDLLQNEVTAYTVLVVDTNVFISCLSLMKTILKDTTNESGPLLVLLPWAVLQELDYLKDRLREQCMAAVRFINQELLSGNPSLISQSPQQAMEKLIPIESNDDKILVCCLQRIAKYKKDRVILVTRDINLSSKANVSGIESASNQNLWRILKKRQSSHIGAWHQGSGDVYSVDSSEKPSLISRSVGSTKTVMVPKHKIERPNHGVQGPNISTPVSTNCAEQRFTNPDPLPTNIAVLSDKMAPLQSKMAPLSIKMAPLLNEMAALSNKVTPLSNKMAPLSNKMAPLSNKMAPLSNKMAPLSNKMAPLSNEMAPLSNNVSQVPNDIIASSNNMAPSTTPTPVPDNTSPSATVKSDDTLGNVIRKLTIVWELIHCIRNEIDQAFHLDVNHPFVPQAKAQTYIMARETTSLHDKYDRCLMLSPLHLQDNPDLFHHLKVKLDNFDVDCQLTRSTDNMDVVYSVDDLIRYFKDVGHRPTLFTGLEQLKEFCQYFKQVIDKFS